jgi:CRP-like cAMP-binding protein
MPNAACYPLDSDVHDFNSLSSTVTRSLRVSVTPTADSAIRRADVLRGLPLDVVAPLLPQFKQLRVAKGDLVTQQGTDRRIGLYVISSGRIVLERRVARHPRASLTVLGPEDTFGFVTSFDRGGHTHTAVATDETELYFVPNTDLLNWTTSDPALARHVMRVLAERVRRINAARMPKPRSASQRVARTVLDLTARFGEAEAGGLYVYHGLTQAQLGQLTGVSREYACRALGRFASFDWLRLWRESFLMKNGQELHRFAFGAEARLSAAGENR